MRTRDRILKSLETAYRERFKHAQEREDAEEMSRLDFEFQKEQIHLEVLLDIRELLSPIEAPEVRQETSLLDEGTALMEKAGKLRRLTRLR
jgi:hypothetical protein